MRGIPVSAWIKLAAGDSLAGRFASNAARQALGAALFFATTLLLSGSLGTSGYAAFFRNWNAANLVASVTEFGLFADIMRRFVLGESRSQVVRALWRRQVLQIVAIAAASALATRLSDYDGLFILTVACSVAVGNALAATGLGRDLFRTFMIGELTHNAAFFLLVAIIAPQDPRTAGYLIAAAVTVKCAAYALFRADAGREERQPPKPPPTSLAPGYAGRAYIHSLALLGTYRGFFVIIGYVLSPQHLERIALAWSLCDRALVLVQGVSLVLQPRLIAGMVSRRARNLTYAGTVTVFVVVALTMTGLAQLWLLKRGQAESQEGMIGLSILLCLAFVPHVVRVLRLSEFAAEGRFRTVFSSHLAATIAFAAMAIIAPWVGFNGTGFAAALVGGVSLAGLLAFQEQEPCRER